MIEIRKYKKVIVKNTLSEHDWCVTIKEEL